MPSPRVPHGELLDTPAAIWKAFTARGGLDLKYHNDMDEDIVRTFLRASGSPPPPTLEAALRDPDLTVEDFMGRLLEALNPFSRMLSDLLAMFEQAGARRTDHSLRIDFDFGNAPKLSFDLRQFRDWLETVKRVRELVGVRRWSLDALWTLNSLLGTDSNRKQQTDAAEPWLFEYRERRRWPDFQLPRPVSGDTVLDETLRKCFKVWETVVRESSRFGPSRDELRERGARNEEPAEQEDGWTANFLVHLDLDNWAGFVAASMHNLALMARSLPEAERRRIIDERVRPIEELFARVPTTTVEEENVRRMLVEFLNLPIWQRRHELYSAWVVTLIADALAGRDLHFHLDNGLLSFSFGGSHLATAQAMYPRLHVWAELRSPLTEPSPLSGRRHIQPDYTLVTDPITSPGSAVAVVECKQYRRFSKRNFSHAVVDYAEGRPNAQIVLAAYGPVRDDFLAELLPETAARITLIGGLRPTNSPARDAFRATLQNALAKRYASVAEEPPSVPSVPISRRTDVPLMSVRLSWSAKPRDLDLHLGVWYGGCWTTVNFRSSGNVSEFPWAALDHDVQRGFGPEMITIAKLLDGTYRCYVNDFSGDAPLVGCGAEVAISYHGSEMRVTCPRAGSGRFWHVFDYFVEPDRFVVVNTIVEGSPVEVSGAEENSRGSGTTIA